MQPHGLSPNATAERSVLVRRLYLDLLGVPPTVDELKMHLADTDPAWYTSLSTACWLHHNSVLGSRDIGWTWFATRNLAVTSLMKTFLSDHYRDYVVRAINEDLPYDQFVTEHIAGDLLAKPRSSERGWNESVIATGFWHLGEWVHSPVDSRKDETDRFDNMIDVFSKSILGLTVACARCHDHKFDAIGTADYYAWPVFCEAVTIGWYDSRRTSNTEASNSNAVRYVFKNKEGFSRLRKSYLLPHRRIPPRSISCNKNC